MPINYVKGNLFWSTFSFDAIGHGCNAEGVMGAGIAVEFKRRWPKMFEFYRKVCKNGTLKAGELLEYKATLNDKPIVIYNLMTQKTIREGATLKYIQEAFEMMIERAEENGIKSIGIPRIGAGLGGLRWEDIEKIIEDCLKSSDIQITVVTL